MKNKYEERGEVTVIWVTRKGQEFECLIDSEDLPLIKNYTNSWTLIGGTKEYAVSTRYDRSAGRSKTTYLHRLLLNFPPGLDVDHINGNTLDNRKSNLRAVKHAVNSQNRTKLDANNTSGFRGVYYHSQIRRWFASYKVDGRQVFVGTFDTPEAANAAVKAARAAHMPGSTEAREAA